MLTVDMIVAKKKRIALEIHRRKKETQNKKGLWNILSSAVNRLDTSGQGFD